MDEIKEIIGEKIGHSAYGHVHIDNSNHSLYIKMT